jgi:hypothetical protein
MYKNSEKLDRHTIGLVYDELIDKKGKVVYTKSHNLIVNKFYDLVGGLLKNEATFTGGIQYWAIGEGEGSSWDSLTPAEREAKSLPTLTGLYNEIARVLVTMSYLDSSLIPTLTITNRIQITASFGSAISGYLREFAIFGGTATASINSGYMLNHKTHAVIPFNIGGGASTLNRMLRLIL